MNIALLVLYKLIMDFFYSHYIYKIWKNVKWCQINPNFADEVVSWIIYAAMLALIMPILQKPFTEYSFSEYILFFLLLFSVVPELSICGAGTFSKKYFGLLNIYWLLMFLLHRFSFWENGRRLFQLPCLPILNKDRMFWGICIVCAAVVVLVFFCYGGQFFASSLISSDVYVTRAAWNEIYYSMPAVFRYITANASMVMCFLILYLFAEKRYLMAGVVCLFQYMNFSCGAKKIDLLMMIICIVVCVMRNFVNVKWIVGFAMGSVLLIIGMYEHFGDWSFMGLGKRVFFLPNVISWCYYNYFRTHLPIISNVFGLATIDKGSVPTTIGLEYGRSAIGTYANTGLFGDAFMMFGVYAILLGPILWSLYLYLLDEASKNVNFVIKIGLGACWALVMQNCYITTSMLSHGGVMLIVLLYLREEMNREA